MKPIQFINLQRPPFQPEDAGFSPAVKRLARIIFFACIAFVAVCAVVEILCRIRGI